MRIANIISASGEHGLRGVNRQAEQGFSLLEMSIYLIIVGVLIGSSLTFGGNNTGLARLKQTYDKMAAIEEALALYVSINGVLPCPTDPTVQRTNKTAAYYVPIPQVGDAFCGNDTENQVDLDATGAATADGDDTNDIYVGNVPVKAITLPIEFMFDGWGNRFTYVVDYNFTPAPTPRRFAVTGAGIIEVYDSRDPTGVNPPPRTTEAVYVLLSHGDNGHGAVPKDFTTPTRLTRGGISAAEAENADTPPAGVYDRQFVQGMRLGDFDDILHFRTRAQLMKEAGAAIVDERMIDPLAPDPATAAVLGDVCKEAVKTLKPINNPTLDNNEDADAEATAPIEGPVGCEVEPLPTGTDLDEQKEYIGLTRNANCVARQIQLAEAVWQRCAKRF